MNILYIADVQGPEIIRARGIKRNVSIAGNTKVFGICQAMAAAGHKVIVYSPASVAERSRRVFGSRCEELPARGRSVMVVYGATVDSRALRDGVGLGAAAYWLPRLVHEHAIDTVCVYNITALTLFATVLLKALGMKVIMEYEDSALAARVTSPPLWKRIYRVHELAFRELLDGAFAPNEDLLKRLGARQSLCLPGVLDEQVLQACASSKSPRISENQPLRLIYAGGLDISKGIDRFLEATQRVSRPLELHVCGRGPLEEHVRELCSQSRHKAVFHGLLPREQLVELLASCDVGVNPHRSDLHQSGSWPFKVVEYLAACGTVFCSDTGVTDVGLKARLFMYSANEVAGIADALEAFLQRWPQLAPGADERRRWAIANYGPDAVVRKIERLIAANERAPVDPATNAGREGI